jgi:tRNA(Ile)-lysidine synthase
MTNVAPITADEFARWMAQCGPFEPRPRLAVAVSGGADSLALTLLAQDWARKRRGRILALTVDHGLRPGSGAEARRVAAWLRRPGITHRILRWTGPKPETGLQAAARAARYRLLEGACRAAGIVHLLLAHTRDDQAETVLLRLEGGSGPFGLAAMPIVHEIAAARLLRPLLAVARARLEATLAARKQVWIDDPSNRDARFARARLRTAFAVREDAAELRASLAAAAADLGRFRAREEQQVAALLARTVELRPEGYAWLDLRGLGQAAPQLAWRALAAVLTTVGGLAYPPRADAVRALLARLLRGATGTLARCRIMAAGDRHLVLRELRGFDRLRVPRAARSLCWDGRFAVMRQRATSRAGTLSALGETGWAEAVAKRPALRRGPIPHAARLATPAIRDASGLVAAPLLGFARDRAAPAYAAAYRPLQALAGARFAAERPAAEASATIV